MRIDSGAWSTIPQATKAEGIGLGANLDIEDYVVWKPVEGVGYVQNITGAAGPSANSMAIRDVDCTLFYDSGTQTAGDDYWGYNLTTSVTAHPNEDSATWSGRTKTAAGTDAREDSAFGSGLTVTAAA